jgi:AraC-like DNA-binding protein
MNNQYPKYSKTDEKDPAIWKLRGWAGRFYKLFSNLQFTRQELQLSEDLCVIQTDLHHGHIKVGGFIDPGRLTISFYEGSDATRLSGSSAETAKVAISYNGCKWDAAIQSPASSFVINFSEKLSAQIVSEAGHSCLMTGKYTPSGERLSQVFPTTPTAGKLKHAIQSGIRLAENNDGSDREENLGNWLLEDLISLSSCLVDEISDLHVELSSKGEASRYDLAREIEKLLWSGPNMENIPDMTLDSLASQFGCSRRQIQLAILENFGVCFTELKRSVRLHQAYDALNNNGSYRHVSSVAYAYEFDHLSRFSQYYKEMFGVLPSKHLAETKGNETKF